MSGIAEWFRKRVLREQITRTRREAADLWFTILVAYGMGSGPRPDLHDRFYRAARESERLTLEYRVSL